MGLQGTIPVRPGGVTGQAVRLVGPGGEVPEDEGGVGGEVLLLHHHPHQQPRGRHQHQRHEKGLVGRPRGGRRDHGDLTTDSIGDRWSGGIWPFTNGLHAGHVLACKQVAIAPAHVMVRCR